MSQRNFPSTPTASRCGLDDNVQELISELENLKSIDQNKNGRDSTRQKLCQLLCRLHSPRVARQVAFVDLESNILSKTCPLTRDYFEGLFRDLQYLRDEAVLYQAVGCLESLSELTAYVLEEMKGLDPQETLRNVESLPFTGVLVIKSCYQICADIGLSASPEALNVVAKSLVSSAQDLLTRLGAFYELVQVADLSNYSQFVDSTFAAFVEAVEITRPLDVKMFSKLTKIAIKFLLQQQSLAQELGHLEVILQFYFGNIVSSLSVFPLPADLESVPSLDRAFVDESRVCQFLARVASQMVENVHSLLAAQFLRKILDFLDRMNLLLTVGIDEDGSFADSQSLQRPAIPPLFTRELSTALRPSVYHISKSLLHDEPFQRSLLDWTAFSGDYSPRAFGRLVTLVDVLEQLGSLKSEEAIATWVEPLSPNDPNIIETILRCVEICQPELLLPVKVPGPMHGGKAQRDASLYSVLLYRLNYLLSRCSASAFDFVEPLLLRWSLVGSSLSSSLAADVLCFVIRLASPEVGWNLTVTTARLYDRILGNGDDVGNDGELISNNDLSGLKNLLPRLFSFLGASHRTEFCRRFPINRHLDLWCMLPLKEAPEAAKEIFTVLTKEWNLHCGDLLKFLATLRRYRRVISQLRGGDVTNYGRHIYMLVRTSLKLIIGQADFIPCLATEILHLVNNALEVSMSFAGVSSTTAKSVLGDEQLLTVLRWCNENVGDGVSPFHHAASCLLLTLSSYAFDQDLYDQLLMEYLKLLTGLLKSGVSGEPPLGDNDLHPCVRLNCLLSVERRAQLASDTHVIAAYLTNDETIRQLARPFLERRKKIGDRTDFLGRLRKEVFADRRRRREEVGRAKEDFSADEAPKTMERRKSKSESRSEPKSEIRPTTKSETRSEPKSEARSKPKSDSRSPPKEAETESMDFNLMSEDEDEIFSQGSEAEIHDSQENIRIAQRGGDIKEENGDVIEIASSRDNSQKSSSSVIAVEPGDRTKAVKSEIGMDEEEKTQVVMSFSKDDILDDDDKEATPIQLLPRTRTTSSDDDPEIDELIGTQASTASDVAAYQQLVDGSLKEVRENVKTLASYCANLKELLPNGELPRSTRDEIQACLDDLKLSM